MTGIRLLNNHFSLLVMLIGSASFFLSNILFKDILSLDQYYKYSILITLISILNSFGAFGTDQVILRLSKIKNQKIKIDSKVPLIAFFSILISAVFAALYLNQNFNFFLNAVFFIGIILCMLLYNILRLLSLFVFAQLLNNTWKISLIFFFIMCLINFQNFDNMVIYLCFMVWFFNLLVVVFLIILKKILFEKNMYSNKTIFGYTFYYFISLLGLSFLAQGDRLMIEAFFTKESFNNYFYLSSIFVFPFSLLQSYVGFKELVKMKTLKTNLRRLSYRVAKFSVLFSLGLLTVTYFVSSIGFLKVDYSENIAIILFFNLLGNIKMQYSIYSSFIGAKAELDVVKKVNILFVTISSVLLLCFYFYIKSILLVLIFITILWTIRVVLWRYYSLKYEN